jgi:hypothetical protein
VSMDISYMCVFNANIFLLGNITCMPMIWIPRDSLD